VLASLAAVATDLYLPGFRAMGADLVADASGGEEAKAASRNRHATYTAEPRRIADASLTPY
jgi:hypothetical protein